MCSDSDFFPYYGEEIAETNSQFRLARKYHIKAMKQPGKPIAGRNIAKAALCYQAALDGGVLEAAANILCIMVPAMMRSKKEHPDDPVPLQGRAWTYINALEDAHYPEGAYYRAICLLYGLLDTGNTPEGDLEIALLLDRLALGDYECAQAFLDYLVEMVEP